MSHNIWAVFDPDSPPHPPRCGRSDLASSAFDLNPVCSHLCYLCLFPFPSLPLLLLAFPPFVTYLLLSFFSLCTLSFPYFTSLSMTSLLPYPFLFPVLPPSIPSILPSFLSYFPPLPFCTSSFHSLYLFPFLFFPFLLLS